MQHFYESIDGWFNFRDIYDLAIDEAVDGAVFVEVGSWYGRSAAYMAVAIANSGKRIDFHCVDTWKGSIDTPWMQAHLVGRGGSAFPFFRENLQRGGVWHLVNPIEVPSHEAATRFADSSIDFVLIDGSHDFESVRSDVRAWLPKVKPGGLIAGDDADWPGVLLGLHETVPTSEVRLVNGGANWMCRRVRPERGVWTHRREGVATLDHLAYVPFVNRPDLLDRAVGSIADLWDALIVIDQSANALDPGDHPWMKDIAGVFRSPPGSMSFSQMMNWARAEAIERGVEYLVFMHNDAECRDSVARRVLADARARPSAGVVFTHYDAFAVFRVAALRDVGPWDETFRWYFADNDFYFRMRRRGWEISDFGGELVVHHGSQTLHTDPQIAAAVSEHWSWHDRHYRHKWGGPPGRELHAIPYDGCP